MRHARRPRALLLLPIALALLAAGALAGPAYDGSAPPALPDGDGGLAGLPAADVETIRQARDALKDYFVSGSRSRDDRRLAVVALGRLHEALNDWGRQGQLEWYLQQLERETDDSVEAALAEGAQCAARARQYHLGGARAFWRKLAETHGAKLPRLLDRVHAELARAAGDFARATRVTPETLKPFKLTAPNISVKSVLKPYPIPKPKGK